MSSLFRLLAFQTTILRTLAALARNIRRLPSPLTSRLVYGATAMSVFLQSSEASALPSMDPQDEISSLAPSDGYIRIDEVTLKDPKFAHFVKNNALHDTLMGEGMVELFQVYQHEQRKDILCIVRFGHRVNGYPGLVHGGISSLVIDSLYGWTFMAHQLPSAYTANLNVNYRYPCDDSGGIFY